MYIFESMESSKKLKPTRDIGKIAEQDASESKKYNILPQSYGY